MVLMQVLGVTLDPQDKEAPVLMLRQTNVPYDRKPRFLPVWLGITEAMSIGMVMQKIQIPRPLSQDMLLAAIHALGGRVTGIFITKLQDRIYYAHLDIMNNRMTAHLECRPVDAAVISLRLGMQILVDPDVVKAAQDARTGLNPDVEYGHPLDSIEDMINEYSDRYAEEAALDTQLAHAEWALANADRETNDAADVPDTPPERRILN